MRVEFAIVSDTHWRDRQPDLDRLIHRLYGAHVILHAGDAVSPAVIEALEEVAPVLGVVGNCCQPGLRQRFPLQRVDEFSGLKIGMLHGHLVDLSDPEGVLGHFPADVQRLEQEFRNLALALPSLDWHSRSYGRLLKVLDQLESGSVDAFYEYLDSKRQLLDEAWARYAQTPVLHSEVTAESVVGHRLLQRSGAAQPLGVRVEHDLAAAFFNAQRVGFLR